MIATHMSDNGRHITAVAMHSWSCALPISFAVQQCQTLGLYRNHITRFIEAIYEQQDTDYDVWLDHDQFGDES